MVNQTIKGGFQKEYQEHVPGVGFRDKQIWLEILPRASMCDLGQVS